MFTYFLLKRKLMTIKAEVDQILAVVTANTAALAALADVVAKLNGGSPADLTPVTDALTKVNASLADIQAQLETSGADTTAGGTGNDTTAA